jgi:cytoskeleton protein RodZ
MNERAAEGIGARLAAAREACGMTSAAAAARLRCDESLLLALEQERFEAIGAAVFVQGHLRRYAELLGIPSAPLLASFAEQPRQFVAPDLTRIPRPPVRTVDTRSWARTSSVIAASLVIAIAAWWILQGSGVAPTAAPAPTLPAPIPPASTSSVEPSAVTDSAPVIVPAPLIEPEVAPASAPSPVPAPVAAMAVPTFVLSASAECWVEIYDARGRRLVFDMLRPGAPMSVSGQLPLRLLLGRAEAVTLQWEGRSLRVPTNLIRNSTARVVFAADGTFSAAPPVSPSATP